MFQQYHQEEMKLKKRLSENDLLTEIVKKLRQEVTEIHLTSILHAGLVRSL